MRIPYFAYPRKVKSSIHGWKGWRVHIFQIIVREGCPCGDGICAADFEDEEGPWMDLDCECRNKKAHTHSGFGWSDRPVGFPRRTT